MPTVHKVTVSTQGPEQNEGRYTGLAMRVATVSLTWSHALHEGRLLSRAMRAAKVSIQVMPAQSEDPEGRYTVELCIW